MIKRRPEDAALVIVDLQVGHLPSIRTLEPPILLRNTVVLHRIARLYEIPVFLTTAQQPGPAGEIAPELSSLSAEMQIYPRTEVDFWQDSNLREGIVATGRQHIILAGVALDVGLLLPALSARADGYSVTVVVDATGATDLRIEQATFAYLAAREVSLCSVAGLGMGWQGDLSRPNGRSLLSALGAMHASESNPFASEAPAE